MGAPPQMRMAAARDGGRQGPCLTLFRTSGGRLSCREALAVVTQLLGRVYPQPETRRVCEGGGPARRAFDLTGADARPAYETAAVPRGASGADRSAAEGQELSLFQAAA